MKTPKSGPLSGIRVADLTSILLGPFATQILGDMGADVIKVESPDGDTTRDLGPRRSEGMASVFLNSNRNKRSLSIDLKSPEGMKVFRDFLKTVDVFVHNMRPSAIKRLNLTYDDIKGISLLVNPFTHKGIIYIRQCYDSC